MSWGKPRLQKAIKFASKLETANLTPETLARLYLEEKRSIPELYRMFPGIAVYELLVKYGIPRRKTGEGYSLSCIRRLEAKGITKSLLEELYLNQKLSCREIDKKLGCSASYYLKVFGIPRRKRNERNGSWMRTLDTREKIRQAQLHHFSLPGAHEAASRAIKELLASGWKPNTSSAHAKTRQIWADPEKACIHLKKIMQGARRKPNHTEFQLALLLTECCPKEYVYTEDGKVIIGTLIPDFTNVNGHKKVIELYGDYWHRGQTPEDRIRKYRTFGYECLVLWEHELEMPKEELICRIQKFNK